MHSKEDMAKHIHRIDHRVPSKTSPFFGPVSARQNPSAHGGVCEIATCQCGATRRTNVNGSHRERRKWVEPADPTTGEMARLQARYDAMGRRMARAPVSSLPLPRDLELARLVVAERESELRASRR